MQSLFPLKESLLFRAGSEIARAVLPFLWEISVYGYYHVVQKGCGDQLIFEDTDDRLYLHKTCKACPDFPGDLIVFLDSPHTSFIDFQIANLYH